MAREYTVTGDNQTVVGGPTLVFINPKASPSSALEFLRCYCSQRANATSAQQGIRIGTQVTAFPTVVGATPSKQKISDPASLIVSGTGGAGTSGINASAEGAGSKTINYPDNFNVLNGWLWVATPPETMILGAGEASGFGLSMSSTPGTLTGWSFGVVFREL